MTFLDTSAVIAIIASQPDAEAFAAKLAADRERICAGHVILEASMRLSTLLGFTPTVADQLVTRLLREAGIVVVPITEDKRRDCACRGCLASTGTRLSHGPANFFRGVAGSDFNPPV